MFKNCRICGAEFETNNPRCCTCSPTCSMKNRSIVAKKRYYANPEIKQQSNVRQREKSRQRSVPCRICGENVPSVFTGVQYGRKRYHEECVVKEALKALSDGKKSHDKVVWRARNTYGYTIKDLKELLNNE